MSSSVRDAQAELQYYAALLAALVGAAAMQPGQLNTSTRPLGPLVPAAAFAVYSTVRHMCHTYMPSLPQLIHKAESTAVRTQLAELPAQLCDALLKASSAFEPLSVALHGNLARSQDVADTLSALEAAADKGPSADKQVTSTKARKTKQDSAAEMLAKWCGRARTMDKPLVAAVARLQLGAAGPYLTRTIDSVPDERVEFIPDRWQVGMLDAVDRRDSLLVVAPTSAGKTFVSYYTMRNVLRENKAARAVKSRVVFLMPTKALVLQTMGDLYLRYHNFIAHSTADAPMFATWTRDFRDENYAHAQILVTMPELLELKLTTPCNSAWCAFQYM
jgi:superfamily II RNA helicase